jgi:hypothetical protein
MEIDAIVEQLGYKTERKRGAWTSTPTPDRNQR